MGLIIGIFAGAVLNRNNKKECLHCGDGPADYCESCYQMLAAKNLILQTEKENLEIEQRNTIRSIEAWKQLKEKYIKDLEHIRDCYFHDIKEREESKKMFRIDKGEHFPRID